MGVTGIDAITQIPLSMLPIDWDKIDPSKLQELGKLLELPDEQYRKLEAERAAALQALQKSTGSGSTTRDGDSTVSTN